jgi:hypothetical protein
MPTTRYVKASAETFGTSAGGFTSPDAPAKRLADALKVAVDGDTIRILDTAVYAEGELVVDRPLTIESAAAATVRPTDPAFRPKALPRIRPRADRGSRVFRIQAAGNRRNQLKGPVVLRGLTIERGRAKNTTNEPAFGHGGGIAIVDLEDVWIERCCIRDNKTDLVPFRKVSTAIFKDILTAKAGVIILAAIVAADVWTGDVHIDSAVRDALAKRAAMEIRHAIDERLPDRLMDSLMVGQGSGGGACFVWSSGRMSDCLVKDNVVANGRGGGVGVVGFGWPTLERCLIVSNKAGSEAANRNDGGGIGLEIAVPDKVSRDLKLSDMLTFARRWLATQPPSKLIALGGEPLVRAIATLDFKGFLDVFLVEFTRAFLAAERWNHWDPAAVKKAQTSQVVITDCTVKDNTARDDGGGLYASVLSRFRVEGGSFVGNVAQHGKGGGLRASMGSDAALSGVKVQDNHTEGKLFDASGKPLDASGGGGIACRNGTLTLGGSKGGCNVTGNKTAEWAGGGILVEAVSEGRIFGVPDLWHAILTEVFEVTEISATIDAATTVKGNIAGTGKVVQSAKGGGLYILRGEYRAAPDLKVSIKQFRRNVSGNHGRAGTFVSKLTGKSIKADEVDLVDEHERVDDGDAEAGKHLGSWNPLSSFAKTTFHYES